MDQVKIKKLVLKNKFNINETVFHKMSEEKGLITMVRIVVDSTHQAVYEYYVAVAMGHSTWVEEIELSNEFILN